MGGHPPVRRRAARRGHRPRRPHRLPRQEQPGDPHRHPGGVPDRGVERDRQLAARRRRARLRHQRLRGPRAVRRARADAVHRAHPRQAHQRREGHRGRRRQRRARGLDRGRRADRPAARRDPRRRLPGHVQLGHHRTTQGCRPHPAQHGDAHAPRHRRHRVRRGRHDAHRDADVPRRRVVVRAVQPRHRHRRLHHPRGQPAAAGPGDDVRRHARVPGSGRRGRAAAGRSGGDGPVQPAQGVLLRCRSDAAADPPRGPGGLADHEVHAGVRHDRVRRRRHDPRRRRPPRHRSPRAPRLGGPADPRRRGPRRRPGDARGRRARHGRRAVVPHRAVDARLPRPARGDPRADHRRRLGAHRRHRTPRRRGLRVRGGPGQGHDHLRRREHLLTRGRTGARRASVGARARGHRRAGRHDGASR